MCLVDVCIRVWIGRMSKEPFQQYNVIFIDIISNYHTHPGVTRVSVDRFCLLLQEPGKLIDHQDRRGPVPSSQQTEQTPHPQPVINPDRQM